MARLHDVTEAEERDAAAEAHDARPHRTRNRWLAAILVFVSVCGIALGIVLEYVAHHAGPLLRSSVIATLSTRFHSPVELDSLEISVVKGLQVHGRGLRVQYLAGPTRPDVLQRQGLPAPPMLSVKEFTFRTTMDDLLHLRANIAHVDVDGMELHIPPRSEVRAPPVMQVKSRIALHVEAIYCKDVKLVIETGRPDKAPLQFLIKDLRLTGVGTDQPMDYVADLVNPRPVGDIHASGRLGPWVMDDPRLTPVDGQYTFTHVDLSSIKGLRGTLSSAGQFQGHLSQIAIDGSTSTPDFALDVSGHPVPLETKFHAAVDATTGDTTLNPVSATLRRSEFTAQGTVMRIMGKGHDIALTIDMPDGRMEDVLQLSMKTEPPVIRGAVALHAKLHIPPGEERISQKLELAGNLRINHVEFTSTNLQERVDALSVRAKGGLHDAKADAADRQAQDVASKMAVTFSLLHAVMLVPSLKYEVPGVTVQMDGVYLLDGRAFEFRGHTRTEATASEMVTGWKSALLKPFDGMFKKDGAGADIPIEITGSNNDFKLGFAMHGADETPQQIEANLRAVRAAEPDAAKVPARNR